MLEKENRKRVFVVEDSELIRERLISEINDMPCCLVVGSADTEGEAIRLVRKLRPDLVVSDIQLRDGSGLAVLRDIRAAAAYQPTVLMLTNHASKEYRARSLAAGADAVFDKTAQYEDFLSYLAAIPEPA
jgi:DNA-binding NarL/FixJ family response regulator